MGRLEVVASKCDPSSGEAETGGSLAPAQPVREFGFSERPYLKTQGGEQLSKTRC